jgi:hypothetical protein
MNMLTAYVAGPVLRPSREQSWIASLYAALKTAAKAHGVQITLPIYSDRLDGLTSAEFAKEIRGRIDKVDALIAVIARPASPEDLSGYSIAAEAHEATRAGKPVALLAEDKKLALPRLLVALDGVQVYAFAGEETLILLFEYLASEIRRRAR